MFKNVLFSVALLGSVVVATAQAEVKLVKMRITAKGIVNEIPPLPSENATEAEKDAYRKHVLTNIPIAVGETVQLKVELIHADGSVTDVTQAPEISYEPPSVHEGITIHGLGDSNIVQLSPTQKGLVLGIAASPADEARGAPDYVQASYGLNRDTDKIEEYYLDPNGEVAIGTLFFTRAK